MEQKQTISTFGRPLLSGSGSNLDQRDPDSIQIDPDFGCEVAETGGKVADKVAETASEVAEKVAESRQKRR